MDTIIQPASENAVIFYFSDHYNATILQQLRTVYLTLKEQPEHYPLVTDLIPCYRSLLVYFNPKSSSQAMNEEQKRIGDLIKQVKQQKKIDAHQEQLLQPVRHSIPCYYHSEVGYDLEFISSSKKMSIDRVIELHSKESYTVYGIGFLPNFSYLGQIPSELEHPRLEHPRDRIAAGSVALADRQTAIYPLNSPGGWIILGRTPLKNDQLNFTVGDLVKFEPIDRRTFLKMGGEI